MGLSDVFLYKYLETSGIKGMTSQTNELEMLPTKVIAQKKKK